MNISSVVIQVAPKDYDKVLKALKKEAICDFHFGDKEQGKLIVTIEGKDTNEEIKKVSMLQKMDKVINANMIQTYQEDLEVAREELGKQDVVADVLSDNVDAKDVVYNGDLRKKDFYGGV